MGRSDSPPSVSTRSILHEPILPCRLWFAPLGRGRPTGGQGVVGSGLPIRIDDGNVGASQVPWKPWWSLSVLFDPGRIRQTEWTKSELPDTAPACVHDEGSKRVVFSGLNHTTFDLAVYASQDGSPHHHARLASGCWSSFARRDSYPQGFSERFQSSSLFLPSKAYLTQGHHTQLLRANSGKPEIRNGQALRLGSDQKAHQWPRRRLALATRERTIRRDRVPFLGPQRNLAPGSCRLESGVTAIIEDVLVSRGLIPLESGVTLTHVDCLAPPRPVEKHQSGLEVAPVDLLAVLLQRYVIDPERARFPAAGELDPCVRCRLRGLECQGDGPPAGRQPNVMVQSVIVPGGRFLRGDAGDFQGGLLVSGGYWGIIVHQ